MSHESLLRWANIGIVFGYVIIGWVAIGSTHQLNVAWTETRPLINMTWKGVLKHSHANLTDSILNYSGCKDYTYRDVYGRDFNFSPANSSLSCKCVYDYVGNGSGNFPPTNDDDLEKNLVRCLIGGRAAMKKTRVGKDTLHVSNPVVLVGLWNIISLISVLFYDGETLLGTLRGNEKRFGGFGFDGMLQVTALAVGIIFLWTGSPLPTIVCGFHTLYVIVFFGVCWGLWWAIDVANRPEWIFWMQLLFVLPLAVYMYNIATHRRDLIFMYTSAILSCGVVTSSAAGAMFVYAVHLLDASGAKARIMQAGNNIAHWVVLVNIVIVAFSVQLAYPTLIPQQGLNSHAIAGLSLLILLIAVLVPSVGTDKQKAHLVRVGIEMTARVIISAGCVIDALSLHFI